MNMRTGTELLQELHSNNNYKKFRHIQIICMKKLDQIDSIFCLWFMSFQIMCDNVTCNMCPCFFHMFHMLNVVTRKHWQNAGQ